MDRRQFSKMVPAGLIGLPSIVNQTFEQKNAKPLKQGDTIGLITPSGPITKERLQKSIRIIKELGFNTSHTESVLLHDGYLAGSDDVRLADLHLAFSNEKIDGIWCIRGGYGATRYLDQIDFELIKENPKALIGYSDVTALINTIYQHTGNPCFHGPIAGSTISDFSQEGLAPIFAKQPVRFGLSANNKEKAKEDSAYQYRVIVPGIATGKLAGGNLSLLASLVGTKHAVDTKDKILFIEDIGEEPYRIDRMLTQLMTTGFFDEVKGIILGVFADCAKKDKFSWTLQETIDERMNAIGKPCIYGFPFGHIDDKVTFPIGVVAQMDTSKEEVVLLGSAY